MTAGRNGPNGDGMRSAGPGACLRVLSRTIHFAQVPVWAVYGAPLWPGGYPQLRPGSAGKGCIDAVDTQTAIVDKPVETVDSHRQLFMLPMDGGRAGSDAFKEAPKDAPNRFRGPHRRRG